MSLRRQGTTLFAAMLIFVGAAVVLQLWLLTLSVEALLSGQYKTLVPAAARINGAAGHQRRSVALCLPFRPRCPRRMRPRIPWQMSS